MGKGEAILTTPSHLQTHDRTKLLEIWLDLISHLMERFALAEVEGPAIEYIVNRTEQGILVVLANHEGQQWSGKVTANRLGAGDVHVAELWEDRKVEHSMETANATFEAHVPAYAFRVYAVEPVRSSP